MKCENCGKEHDGSYGSGRFCCKECARSYSTKKDNNKELKEAKCIKCGKIIYINKRQSLNNCKCKDCYNEDHLIKCKICGQYYEPKSGGCKNNFCKSKKRLTQINTLIKYFGFDKNKLGTLEVENEFNRIKNYFEYLYNDKKFSMIQIGELFNYKFTNNLSKIFKYMNIKRRCRKEIIDNAIFTRRWYPSTNPYQFHREWHTSWEGNEYFFRSSYELDYANILDKEHIKYEYESKRIKYFNTKINNFSCSIPDFYLPETNTIVEIKSVFTLELQELKDKVKEYKNLGYNFKLILEGIETNIEELDENKIYYLDKPLHKINDYSKHKKIGFTGWTFINKDGINRKCMKEDLETYLNNGWKHGRIKNWDVSPHSDKVSKV